jgi:hypothetical protein
MTVNATAAYDQLLLAYNQLNQMQIVWAILVAIGIGSTILVIVFWVVKNMLRSKSGKVIDSVKSRHKELLLAATPGHRAHLFKVGQFLAGRLETGKFDDRVKNKRKTFREPERTNVFLQESDLAGMDNLSPEEKKQSLALTQECLTHMLNVNTDKVFLEDGVPVTLAVEDKVIVTGVKGIGALAFYEKLYRIQQLREKIDALEQNSTFKDVGEYLKNLLSQVSLINIDVLRNYFDADYNQTDEESQNEYHFMMGVRKGRQGEKNQFSKLIVYGAIGVAIAGVVGGAVLAWLGK